MIPRATRSASTSVLRRSRRNLSAASRSAFSKVTRLEASAGVTSILYACASVMIPRATRSASTSVLRRRSLSNSSMSTISSLTSPTSSSTRRSRSSMTFRAS